MNDDDDGMMREGQPSLLWQMAMLADAGFTILPPVRDPDPDRSFPELTIEMREVSWSDDHYCLVGGEAFFVIAVPPSHRVHFQRPKRFRPESDASPELLPSPAYEVEHFTRRDLAVGFRGEIRWRSRIMFCVGSRADDYSREAIG